MTIRPRHTSPLVLLAACTALLGTPVTAAMRADSSGISTEQADAILGELRAIRTLLEQEATDRKAGVPVPSAPTVVRLPWVERPALGAPDASVIVVEFTDYACPYCQRFHQTTWPVLKRDFIDTGQVRWIIRDLPLPIHPDARGAAQAAHCAGEQGAGEQGRFWEIRSVLFANQGALGREALEKYAVSEGLKPVAFRRCLDRGNHLDAIDADASDAAQARITGTPTFLVGRRKGDFLEGRLIIGAQSPAVFDGAIRLELAASDTK